MANYNTGGGGAMMDNTADFLIDDMEPQSRDRSNTWPLRRPNLGINNQTSPLIHEEIPEEDNDG